MYSAERLLGKASARPELDQKLFEEATLMRAGTVEAPAPVICDLDFRRTATPEALAESIIVYYRKREIGAEPVEHKVDAVVEVKSASAQVGHTAVNNLTASDLQDLTIARRARTNALFKEQGDDNFRRWKI